MAQFARWLRPVDLLRIEPPLGRLVMRSHAVVGAAVLGVLGVALEVVLVAARKYLSRRT